MCCFTATVISCLTLPKITYSVCHVRTGNTPLPPSSFPPPSIFAAIYSHTVLSHSTYGNLKLYQKRQDREKGVCVWCTNLPHLYMLSELKFNYCHTENKKCSQFSQNMFVTYHGCTAVCEFPRRISPPPIPIIPRYDTHKCLWMPNPTIMVYQSPSCKTRMLYGYTWVIYRISK